MSYPLRAIAIATCMTTGTMVSAGGLAPVMSDSAPAPVVATAYDWTGFHIGVFAEYLNATQTKFFDENGLYASDRAQPSGGVAGVALGYKHQTGAFVLGASAELALGSATGQADYYGIAQYPVEIDKLADLRAKLGYVTGRFLPFVSLGYTYATTVNDATVDGQRVLPTVKDDMHGWSAGVGLEYALNDDYSVGAEYIYRQFSDTVLDFDVAGQTAYDAHAVRIGINYRF